MKRKLQISIIGLFLLFAILFIIASPLTVNNFHLSSIQLLLIAVLVGIIFSIIATLLITLIITLPFEEFSTFLDSTSKKLELPPKLPFQSAPELEEIYAALVDILQKIQSQIPGVEKSIAYGDVRYRLLTTITHRLRTPLTGLRWALSELRKDDTDQYEMLLRGAIDSADNIAKIVEVLVKATQEETQYHPIKNETIDIPELLQGVIAETALLAKSKQIPINMQKLTSPIPTILGDRMELELAFQNIIANAINYSPNGRPVLIVVGRQGNKVMVKVMDKGIGIEEKELPTLFSLFNRGTRAIAMNTEGTGLGLNLTNNIISNHRGNVSIESKKDVGTTVTILLPVRGKGELETFIEH